MVFGWFSAGVVRPGAWVFGFRWVQTGLLVSASWSPGACRHPRGGEARAAAYRQQAPCAGGVFFSFLGVDHENHEGHIIFLVVLPQMVRPKELLINQMVGWRFHVLYYCMSGRVNTTHELNGWQLKKQQHVGLSAKKNPNSVSH